MTMLSTEQKDLLLLYQCIIDTGAEVLREFTEPRLTSGFKDFTEMLEKKKHYFFHQNNKKRLHCCECPLTGCSIPFNCDLDSSLFDKMYVYDNTITIPKGHQTNNGTVQQICLCRFKVTTISINDFDLSNLNYLILKLQLLYSHESNLTDALKNIMKVRGNVMHAVSSQCYSLYNLVNLWNDFDTAILQFAPPKSSFLLKKLIAIAKKALLTEEDINSLMTKASEDYEKAEDDKMTLIHSIEEKVSVIERNTTTIVGAVASTEENIKTYLSQEIQTLEERITERIIGMLNYQKVILSVSQQQLPMVTSQRGTDEGNAHDRQQINATARMTSKGLTEQAEDAVLECLPTEMETEIEDSPPEDTDENFQSFIQHNDRFGILSKRKNCIILELIASPRIFTSKERLRSAILKLVREVLIAGKIDTSIADSIYIKMDFDKPLTKCQYDVLMELMLTPYIDKVEPDKPHSVQSQTDSEYLREETGSVISPYCMEYSEIISTPYIKQRIEQLEQQAKLLKGQTEQQKQQLGLAEQEIKQLEQTFEQQIKKQEHDFEQQIEEQRQQIELQSQQKEKQRQLIEQQIEHQRQQIERQQQIEKLSPLDRIAFEEKMEAPLVSKISDEEMLQRTKKLSEEKSSSGPLEIKSDLGKGYTLPDQDASFKGTYGKDPSTGLHKVYETKRPHYKIERGKVIISCKNKATHNSQDDLKRIQESFAKLPNFTVHERERDSIIDAVIDIRKGTGDCLILILVDVDPSDILKELFFCRMERFLDGIPTVIIAMTRNPIDQHRICDMLNPGERLIVTSYQEPSPSPSNSIFHHLSVALGNMKDEDDFASVLYDVNREINQESKEQGMAINREVSVFGSSLSKQLILK